MATVIDCAALSSVPNTMTKTKQTLRRRLRAHLQQWDTRQRRESEARILKQLLALPQWQQAKRVFCYISCNPEVDTHALIRQHCTRLETLAVPFIANNRHMFAVRLGDWDKLRKGALGILAPSHCHACPGPWDLVITPGLGFSRTGQRLGHGRGYYDRWFAHNEVRCRIALCHHCQLLDALPCTGHDVAMDLVITGTSLIRPQENA